MQELARSAERAGRKASFHGVISVDARPLDESSSQESIAGWPTLPIRSSDWTPINPKTRHLPQVRAYMSLTHENHNELPLLMELRLAFGPGTRLWAYRSREDLCYDWLHFKARRANASFREFALTLYNEEKEQTLHCATLFAIRRRVTTILKAYRVKKRSRIVPASTSPPQSNGSSMSHHDLGRRTQSLGTMPVAQALFPGTNRPPLRESEVAR